ncbi:MAG TPA: DUF2093 domain-containing protein [Parvularcula sp.]|nr:DUF2093 domain-containing protein [Parvularcula sp.]HBS36184.1 DUF2093 domain-containing protein [Parvularcula sp.]
MNPFDGVADKDREAAIEYRDAEFVVIRPGRYVRCAVTGAKIPLEALKYWNVDRQEAYASPEAAMAGFGYKPKP